MYIHRFEGVSILKKNYTTLLALFVSGLMTFVLSKESFAKAAVTGNQNSQNPVVASPVGTQVRNQNEVRTQNMGEEQNIQVSTFEQEGTGSGEGLGIESKNAIAAAHMSTVAEKVQQLLQIKTIGGIGDQVRTIARDQTQAQDQIQLQLDKIDSKGSIAKTFFGPDYKALKSLEQQMEQNRVRIEQLQKLKLELTNSGDQTAIQATIDALIQENTSLQEIISLEENTRSIFGWLVKLFVK